MCEKMLWFSSNLKLWGQHSLPSPIIFNGWKLLLLTISVAWNFSRARKTNERIEQLTTSQFSALECTLLTQWLHSRTLDDIICDSRIQRPRHCRMIRWANRDAFIQFGAYKFYKEWNLHISLFTEKMHPPFCRWFVSSDSCGLNFDSFSLGMWIRHTFVG